MVEFINHLAVDQASLVISKVVSPVYKKVIRFSLIQFRGILDTVNSGHMRERLTFI